LAIRFVLSEHWGKRPMRRAIRISEEWVADWQAALPAKKADLRVEELFGTEQDSISKPKYAKQRTQGE
jgi:hypothetical protein